MVYFLTTQTLWDTYSTSLNKLFGNYSREVGWVVFSKDLFEQVQSGKIAMGVYIEEGVVLGGVQLYLREDGTCKINAIAVLRKHLQRGIGTSIFNYIKEIYPKIEVSCLDDIQANKFYLKYFHLHGTKLSRKNNKINIYRNY